MQLIEKDRGEVSVHSANLWKLRWLIEASIVFVFDALMIILVSVDAAIMEQGKILLTDEQVIN